jgi:hypothetical protein
VQQHLQERIAMPPTSSLASGEGGISALPERGRKIVTMHGVIQSAIGQIQDKTQQILQDQERDLIRAFRARLAQVQEELDRERRKSETGAAEWVVRCHKLTEEVEWLRDLTDKLTSENKVFLKDNQRYIRQLQTREEDRAFLIKQLVASKKEIAKLRLVLEREGLAAPELSKTLALPPPSLSAAFATGALGSASAASAAPPRLPSRAATSRGAAPASFSAAPVPALTFGPQRASSAARPGAAQASVPSLPSAGEAADLRAALTQARRDAEQSAAALAGAQRRTRELEKQLRAAQTARTEDLAERSALLDFLKQSVEDVRVDIAERKAAQARATARRSRTPLSRPDAAQTAPPVDPRTIPLEAFTVQDRINTVEWFISQDKVIYTLYDVMFPSLTRRTLSAATGPSALAGAGTARLTRGATAGLAHTAGDTQRQFAPHSAPVAQFGGVQEPAIVVNDDDLQGLDLFSQDGV